MAPGKNICLTVDDGPTRFTREIVAFLKDRNIPAIMFFTGENIYKNYEVACNAIKNGFIIGNHSYSHKRFSSIPIETAIDDIIKCENAIEDIYGNTKIERRSKLFRFPFGDKGYKWTRLNVLFKNLKSKYRILQNALNEMKFEKLPISNLQSNFYYNRLLYDIDLFWTFDSNDWQLRKNKNFTTNDLDNHLQKLHTRPNNEILLMHDRNDTPESFFYVIDKLIGEDFNFYMPGEGN
ncbi:MAG: polysaccharide deacetylase family protein [candidate division Zixibacteria bacterium]|nr:polysaccharide deacetylase family protein [candidate division Zixibacteria bacterium]